MGAEKSLKGAETIFLALLIIGLMGLLFLIIYGNLSGNLGFSRDTASYLNESGGYSINDTTYTLANGASTPGFVSLSVSAVYNSTDWAIIGAANYTVDATAGTITGTAWGVRTYNYTNVSVSYAVTYKATSERNTDAVIGNLTTGATQFFSFSNVWFILTAITILIGIVLGVIGLVRKAGTSGMGAGKSKSQFVS